MPGPAEAASAAASAAVAAVITATAVVARKYCNKRALN